MKNKNDSNMPTGKLTRVKNFLPSPGELVFPNDTVRVTISLSKQSVEFFRGQAHKYHTKYQKMIRQVLDSYAVQFR